MTLPQDVQYALTQLVERAALFSPRMRELRTRLLMEGGEEVCFEHPEPDVGQLIEEGRVFAHRIVGYPGGARACHQNVTRFWKEEPTRWRIATGYGLNHYGIWIQHSWLVDQEETIYETAGPAFECYFGIVYTQEQARHFVRVVPKPKEGKNARK